MRSVRRVRLIVAIALGLLAAGRVSALNLDTHRLINRRAAESSATLDRHLRESAGLPESIETIINGRTVLEWIEEGGAREDDLLRFVRHFHDPLKPWDLAGLDLGISRHESSVRWMQQPDQAGVSTGGSWSWHDARRLYYDALTARDAGRREEMWADLFRALGQIMHLVVDGSVPEHVRNDMHPLGGLAPRRSYEYWVSGQHQAPAQQDAFVARFLTAPITFAADLLQSQTADDQVARVPVGRLIDADRYDGSNPGITADPLDPRAPVLAGIAEIANANFYSEDTLRGRYPSPTDKGLMRVNLGAPLGLVRRYWSRPAGLGLLPANPLRAECASEAYGEATPPPYPCMDPLAWGQIAAHMLPRAVGYASGVLDYFFRGRLVVSGVEWTPAGIRLAVRNTGAEAMEGVFEIYARHEPTAAAERRLRLATLLDGASVLLGPGQERTFMVSIPPGVDPTAAHVLVFRGRLGLEEGAVAGQVFMVPYVEVRQTSYEADLVPSCGRQPAFVASAPFPAGVTSTMRSESMQCEWRVVNHRASGTLETNAWHDASTDRLVPVIDRIEAEWIGGDVEGPAPLTLDGRLVGSAWQRQGAEPDPLTFAISDATDRSRSYLYLLVTYTNGAQLDAQLAILTRAVTAHGKQRVIDNRSPLVPQYLVTSSRAASGLVAYNWQNDGQIRSPLFEALSHGGSIVPTDEQTERRFGGTRVFREGLKIDAEFYSANAIDHFEIFGTGDDALARYATIEPLVSPHPEGPVYVPVAEIRRRYQPMELEFLRAFVTGNPQPFLVRLAGQLAD